MFTKRQVRMGTASNWISALGDLCWAPSPSVHILIPLVHSQTEELQISREEFTALESYRDCFLRQDLQVWRGYWCAESISEEPLCSPTPFVQHRRAAFNIDELNIVSQ